MKKFISLILVANYIAIPFFTMGQDLKTFTKGSEKPIKINCNQSCKIEFTNYTITTKEGSDEIGEIVSLYNKKSGKKSIISSGDDQCIFDGIYKNYVILSCGTDIIRGITIFDIQKNSSFEVPGGILSISEIKNDNLFLDIQMSEERKSVFKLKDKNCDTQVCGYYEKVIYNLITKRLHYTGKYYWEK